MIALAEPRPDPRQALGRFGEGAAEEWLVACGMRILERRFRTRVGEIDLVAQAGGLVVFVEVKTRRGERAGSPAESVTALKRRRIARVALQFLARRNWIHRPTRFDVVEVRASASGISGIRHIQDAFRPVEPR